MFIVTTIVTEACGEYFDGEPFTIGQRHTAEFADWGNAAEYELFRSQAGFDTDITETVEAEVVPNPVVKTTTLRAYPGWVVRHYQDGMMDATNNVGVTGGSDSFQEVIAMVRADQPPRSYRQMNRAAAGV
jgi:hypothetical protein